VSGRAAAALGSIPVGDGTPHDQREPRRSLEPSDAALETDPEVGVGRRERPSGAILGSLTVSSIDRGCSLTPESTATAVTLGSYRIARAFARRR